MPLGLDGLVVLDPAVAEHGLRQGVEVLAAQEHVDVRGPARLTIVGKSRRDEWTLEVKDRDLDLVGDVLHSGVVQEHPIRKRYRHVRRYVR